MSRIEGKIQSAGEAAVDSAEILAALAKESDSTARRRQDAVSCCLSASEGWRDASAALGGAFAAEAARLTAAKDE